MDAGRRLPMSTETPVTKYMSVDANNKVTEGTFKPEKTKEPVAPPPKDNSKEVGSYPKFEGPVSGITLCAVRHDGSTLGQPQKPQKPESPHSQAKPRFDSGANIIHCAVRPDGSTLGQAPKPKPIKD